MRARRWRSWSGRAPGGAANEVISVADLLGAGVAKALLGKDVLSDELPLGNRVDRPARHPSLVRADEGLRHAIGGRLELPVHPVPARFRRRQTEGTSGPDRCRPHHGGAAVPVRGQPGRGRGRHTATPIPLLTRKDGSVVARDCREERAALVGGDGPAGRRVGRPDQSGARLRRVVAAATRRTRCSPPTPDRAPTGTRGT